MRTSIAYLGIAAVCAVGAAFMLPQGRVAVSTDAVAARHADMSEGGCSGCACCFPRTPDGIVSINGFVKLADGTSLYTVPHDQWLIVTDIEVVAMTADGAPIPDWPIGLYEVDKTSMHNGQRALKRWANCSIYHSARGIPIMPGCDLMIDRMPVDFGSGDFAQPPAPRGARVYYQINGYLWDAGGSHQSH